MRTSQQDTDYGPKPVTYIVTAIYHIAVLMYM